MCVERDVGVLGVRRRSRPRARTGRSRARWPCRPSTACLPRLRAAWKPTSRDALDLRLACSASCRSLSRSPRRVASRAAARLAEVDVAGELADDQDVEAGDDLGLQRRRAGELGIAASPAAGWRTGRAPCAGRGSPARAAARAAACRTSGPPTAPNSTASAALRERERRLGQRIAVRVVGGAADQGAARSRSAASSAARARARPGRRSRGRCRRRRGLRSSLARFARWAPSANRRREPRLLQQALRLERADLVGVAQREPMSSRPFEQAVLAERLDVEGELVAVGRDDDLAARGRSSAR